MQIEIENIGAASLDREERKSLSARVFPNGGIALKAPVQAKDEEIFAFIKRKRRWIKNRLAYFKQFQNNIGTKVQSGSSLLYLGRQ
ncbi:MAG: M48 family metallopeptidase, partial [Endomicrobium sp.]|nr:M48 family metallopeptidase [Endomicrobium sp.]